MLRVLALSCLLGASMAMVCLPEMCDNVKQPLLDCKGGVVKGGGFCGCTDVCAMTEGEPCQATLMFGMVPKGQCDEGLQCVQTAGRALGMGTCVKPQVRRQLTVDAGGNHQKTKCEQMKLTSMISMVVYKGQWFAKCDALGNFLPMQCDNTRHCFCVDQEGVKQEDTYVLGNAKC